MIRRLICSLAVAILLSGSLYAQPNTPAVTQRNVATAEPDEDNVPHGVLHHHTYTTKVALGFPKDQVDIFVYTPPGYSARSATTYPVLYLLHGWNQNAASWSATGHENFILDNLIAAGKAKPMIVVMPTGYGDQSFLTNGFSVWGDQAQVDRNLQLFQQALLSEVMPQVEQQYNVSKDRSDRAIAGLSMGGLESLNIGLNHLDMFGWIGGFSAAVQGVRTVDQIPGVTPANKPKLLWIACGTSDRLLEANHFLEGLLEKHGFTVTAVETPGEHVWAVWHENLIAFAPLLFR